MRCVLVCFAVTVMTIPSYGQVGGTGAPTTRQMAVDAINGAEAYRLEWQDFMEDIDDQVDALPPGPEKSNIEVAYSALFLTWFGADYDATNHIADAVQHLNDGDAETDPLLQPPHWAAAVDDSVAAQDALTNTMATPWSAFLITCAANGWTPTGTPPTP